MDHGTDRSDASAVVGRDSDASLRCAPGTGADTPCRRSAELSRARTLACWGTAAWRPGLAPVVASVSRCPVGALAPAGTATGRLTDGTAGRTDAVAATAGELRLRRSSARDVAVPAVAAREASGETAAGAALGAVEGRARSPRGGTATSGLAATTSGTAASTGCAVTDAGADSTVAAAGDAVGCGSGRTAVTGSGTGVCTAGVGSGCAGMGAGEGCDRVGRNPSGST